ncbi:MAG TPA: DUF374 domain-containing protein [Chitinophagales bacterium]|nr:DUF374 domain-containing protein [Chitinophagales bacterium]
MPYRVDNIPFRLKPFFLLYAFAGAAFLFSVQLLLFLTCKIVKEGEEHSPPHRNHIYAAWHENLLPYFVVYIRYREPYAWINHPLWFMKPVHIVLRWMGMKKLFLGSSGHGGREAMAKVVEHLKLGYSTFLNPDGPAGPYKVLKPGVLEMSRQSGIPVVPIRFELSNYFRLKGWDKKKVPLPFSKIKVIYEKAVLVSDLNFEDARKEIEKALG